MAGRTGDTGGAYRETYAEYRTESGVVGEIVDPENRRAWIRSSLTVPVDP